LENPVSRDIAFAPGWHRVVDIQLFAVTGFSHQSANPIHTDAIFIPLPRGVG